MKHEFDAAAAELSLRTLTFSSLLALGACGGGGGGGLASLVDSPVSGGGIGGTGLSTSGTVDGTGSIFVNGIRFDVDDAEIVINGETASESELGLGMVVAVTGTVEDDGQNGTADRVSFDAELQGPITALERNADNSSARITVLGQIVIVERTGTVFEGIGFDDLAVDSRVEISGYRDGSDRLRATRVEREDSAQVKVNGVIANLTGQEFTIGGQFVDASAATLDDLPNGLQEGLRIDAEGDLVDGVLVARSIEGSDETRLTLEPDDAVLLQGTVREFMNAGDFNVKGLPVDASSATLDLGGLPLGNGVVVEVSGIWNGSRVVAERVSVRRGRIELEAPLADVDPDAGSLTLQFGPGTLTVQTDSRTLFDDDRDDIVFLRIGDLAVGDYLEVEALENGGNLVATRVDRDENDDETELQARVEGFEEDISITVLGLRYDVSNAKFENAGDIGITADAFFANLSVGALVKVKDDEPTDGSAEEVEFEFSVALDGDRDFTDDDEERIDESDLPQAALDYLAANFPGETIAFIERDDDEIEVYLTDGTEVVFDLDGGFIESDVDDDSEDDSDDSDDSGDDDSDDDGSDDSDDDDSDDDGSDDSDDDDSDDDGSDDSDDDDSDDSGDN